jgi:tellurite resistance protein TerC
MSAIQTSYVIFIVAFLASLAFDVIVIMKKDTVVSFKSAVSQYLFWVIIGLLYGVYLYFTFDHKVSITYISAFMLEESLSIDNIFVFILLFTSFQVKEKQVGRLLLIGILLAIVLRLGFITSGIAIIQKFHWVLYLFGALLLYSGFKLFFNDTADEDYNPQDGNAYKLLSKFLPIDYNDVDTTFTKKINGKTFFTKLFIIVVVLAVTDIIFAVDSIPAVLAISQDKLIVFSSNVFAVMGLRALFFVLRIASAKFDYLQQGIAIVLVFIGVKLLLGIFNITISEVWSLMFIIGTLLVSILISYFYNKTES